MALGACLPAALQQLRFKFEHYKQFSDGGVAALGAGLPAKLQQFSLDTEECTRLGEGGVAAVGAIMPAALQQLSASGTASSSATATPRRSIRLHSP